MFVEAHTRPVLAEVCRRLGYPSTNAVLLRHHTNAVYVVRDVVVKIAPPRLGMDRIRAVVDLVRWLAAHGFPTVELSPHLPQPMAIDGYSVTVWQRLDITRPVTLAELGYLLRRLHSLPTPPISLPVLSPVENIFRSVNESHILTDEDRQLLADRLDALGKAWENKFPFGVCLVQSDPQVGNALRQDDGTPVLSDWDGAAIGPREWDIATVAVHCRRFKTSEPNAFAAFTAAYGWDAKAWDGFDKLCRLRELQMIATNARKSPPGTPAAAEVHSRIAGLRSSADDSKPWRIL